jgi:hypothetical protein
MEQVTESGQSLIETTGRTPRALQAEGDGAPRE